MCITPMSLCEFYKEIIPRARKLNYTWIISLIARYSDAKLHYNELVEDWSSIDDLTNDKILFVFSSKLISKNNSFFHTAGKECWVGKMCPFADMVNGSDIRDNIGDLINNYGDYKNIDWKQMHSKSITEFANAYNISEDQIPALFVMNVKTEDVRLLPLSNEDSIYGIVKGAIIKLQQYNVELKNIKGSMPDFDRLSKFFALYDEIVSEANTMDKPQKKAILGVLRGEQSYLECKEYILSSKIRGNIKKIEQWKRHVLNYKDVNIVRKEYEEIVAKRELVNQKINNMWDMIIEDNRTESEASLKNPPNTHVENIIINELLSACVKLLSNSQNNSVHENKRNDNIRDNLRSAQIDVSDQTRYGLSLEGKDSGRVDILIWKDGFPVSIIEALNLNCLNKKYINMHLDKIYNYDNVGNSFNVILSYVTVKNILSFWEKYILHIKNYVYQYPLIEFDEECGELKQSYSNIRVLKTIHNRNGKNTILYHMCVFFEPKKKLV